jgi:LAGLIDADG endonuclease
MSGDNPSSADNQQERPGVAAWLDRIPDDVGNYVAGFVEGEGSFNVPIRRVRGDRCLPWRVGLSFNVSQIGEELPKFLHSVFGAGTVRGREDGVYYFEMTRPSEIVERVFPFFGRFPLRGAKAGDLQLFASITELVQSGAHLNAEGIAAILDLRRTMNRGGKRRYSDQEILSALARQESSETTRQPTPV